MPSATYKGPTGHKEGQATVYVDGVRFNVDQPVEVSDELAAELREGSDRLKGHKFEVGNGGDESGDAEATDESKTTRSRTR